MLITAQGYEELLALQQQQATNIAAGSMSGNMYRPPSPQKPVYDYYHYEQDKPEDSQIKQQVSSRRNWSMCIFADRSDCML
jgi:hypothetical protein